MHKNILLSLKNKFHQDRKHFFKERNIIQQMYFRKVLFKLKLNLRAISNFNHREQTDFLFQNTDKENVT